MIKHRHHPAFSLIEILIVTSVITVGFMAVLGLIRKAIMVYYNNQNYLAAATVAQQGLELTRYIRDENWLTGAPFAVNLAENFQNNTKTILAIDREVMTDDPSLPGNQGRQKIIQFYNSVQGDQLLALNGAGSGDLGAYIKDGRAKIYFDTDTAAGHNFYTTRATLTTTDSGGNVIADLFDANRYTPTIFHNLIQTIYHDNGTQNNSEDDYVYVVSMVYWQDRGADKYFSLATYLDDYSRKY
jgi:hypothetical protein